MKIKLTVPTDLSEIRLSQYQKYYKIQEDNQDESFLATKMIEIFCDISHKDSFRMKLRDVTRVTNILGDMFEQKPQLKKRFVLNGVEYGFIPNLDDMTLGEYVDLDTYISKWDDMHKAMAVLYRPIETSLGNKYTIEKYTGENQDTMKDIPLDIVFGSMLFFYRLGIDLSKVMMSYFQDKKEMPSQQLQTLMQNMDGLDKFTSSVNTILQELKISLN
tara:strand:- start:1652 stop:2302 length:651 start_codon:yes stop_codon:yes gene_type:complete